MPAGRTHRISASRPFRRRPRLVALPPQPKDLPFGFTRKALGTVRRFVFTTLCDDEEPPAAPPAAAKRRRKGTPPTDHVARPGSLTVVPAVPPAPGAAAAAADPTDAPVDGPRLDAAASSTSALQSGVLEFLGNGIVRLPFTDGHVTLGDQQEAESEWQLPTVPWDTLALPQVRKDFYAEHPTTAGRRPVELEPWMAKHSVVTSGADPSNPVLNFSELKLPAQLLLPLQCYTKPSPIQSLAWPALLRGRDVVGVAETGSGKTLAFGLPAMVHASAQKPTQPGEGPIALVVSPTRELALQILVELQRLSTNTKLRLQCIYGGSSRPEQVSGLRQGVDVLVATVGRLMDVLQDNVMTLRRVTYFVLDEADRMLDMGFGPQMVQLRGQVRPDRQTALFSATWPPDVQRLAADFLSEDPLRIQIGGVALTANPSVTQRVIVCPEADKLTRLKALLANLEGKALVFAATRHSCKRLATDLAPAEYPVYCIHSDMAQAEREQTMRRFRQPEESLLVATDVAARGLDVCDIRTVVNYDFPATIADYIHRIGRTGRAGATGDSYSFITPQDGRKARDLIRVMEEAGQPVPHDLRSLHHQHVQRSEHTGGSQRPPHSKAPRPSDKTSERTGRRR